MSATRIDSSGSPLWLAGFRPFFALALVMGILMPVSWAMVFSGKFSLPSAMNPIQWHAHEMLFGFGGAVLIGFLLTASKNWVKVRGIHGTALMILVALWIFERIFFYFSESFGSLIQHIGLSVFVAVSGLYIINTLVRNREKDSFKDNYFFILLLSLILIAKNLLISQSHYQDGVAMSVGLFRMAFTVMFERTITQFMKSTESVDLYRNRILDNAIKISVLLCVFQSFWSATLSATLLSIAALLLFVRWILWKPQLGLRKFGNATMYLGYLGLIVHFIFSALQVGGIWSFGTIPLHIFTFFCMGVVIASMIVRIAQGHTGRKPAFFLSDRIAISLLFAAAFFRLVMPLVSLEFYSVWIELAGLLWSLCFLVLAVRLMPFLFQERIDGKVH